jgi:predicted DNA-binding transcriptional regulator AlpA
MELAGLTEIAQVLSVSRQRVNQLKKTAAFPKPIAVLKMGSVWRLDQIQEYSKNRNVRNGRPKIGSAKPVAAPAPLLGVIAPPVVPTPQPTSHDDTTDEVLTIVSLVPVDETIEEDSPLSTLTERLAYFDSRIDVSGT